MPDYDYETLLHSSIEQKPTEFSDTFQNIFMDKLHHAINNKKIEIAQNMFGGKSIENIDLENETEE